MKTPYQKESPETIQSMFNSIAEQYDRTNSIMSFGLHRKWNRRLVQEVLQSHSISHYLDLCSGTGEIAFGLLDLIPQTCEAFLLDFSSDMLECANNKARKKDFEHHRLHYLEADAQKIPLPGDSLDCATVAYGIRNIKEPKKCFEEVYRVLKPGGKFGILELTQPNNRVMKLGHSFYLKSLLPIIGRFAASNKAAYTYLCNSIHAFTPPEDIRESLNTIGFSDTKCLPLTGGVATIITGVK